MSTLAAALSYSALGWRVFPVHSPGMGDRRCSCSSADCEHPAKHPRTVRGFKDATTDESQIRSWWGRWPDTNVGVATGAVSASFVLDIDPRHGGDASLAELERVHGRVPPTLEAKTGGGGRHLYLAHPGWKLGNRVNLRPGLDVRGDGGYVVAPPSVHATGALYEWQPGRGPGEVAITVAPPWLLDLVAGRPAQILAERARKYCDRADNVATGERNQAAFRLSGHLRALVDAEGRHLSEEEVLDLMRRWNARNAPPLADEELAACVSSSRSNGTPPADKPPRHSATTPGAVNPPPADRPKIDTRRDRLLVQRDALSALCEKNDPDPRLFIRGGQLVRIDLSERSIPTICAVEQPQILDALMQAACFVGGRGENVVPVDPPRSIVSSLLGHHALAAHFPPLISVTRTPVVRPDGSVFTAGGYDKATELYFWSGDVVDLASVPERPSDAEIAAARATIHDELLGEFPFASEADAANAIALLLTPLLRPVIEGAVPGAAIDAPQPRTGKTKIANLASLVAAGHNAAVTSAPKDDVEWKKSISSLVSTGAGLVIVDNVVDVVNSASLASVLTCPGDWSDRVLGKNNATMSLPVRTTWVLTGNNLRLAGDLPHRFYKIRLNAKTARPDLREFKHEDLEAWARTNRSKLLGALLTLVRAWFAKGKPDPSVPRWGGFEQWTRTVGGVLQVGGVKDFLCNREEFLAEADEDSARLEALVRLCATINQPRGFLSADVQSAGVRLTADELAALPLCFTDGNQDSRVRRIGIELRNIVDRQFGPDGLRIERAAPDSHRSVSRWKVVRNA